MGGRRRRADHALRAGGGLGEARPGAHDDLPGRVLDQGAAGLDGVQVALVIGGELLLAAIEPRAGEEQGVVDVETYRHRRQPIQAPGNLRHRHPVNGGLLGQGHRSDTGGAGRGFDRHGGQGQAGGDQGGKQGKTGG